MKIIKKLYIAKLVNAIDLQYKMPYKSSNWRMKKYINLTGLFILMYDSKKDVQYFTWFPYVNNVICYTKGIVSTKIDELTLAKCFQARTQHSIYRFVVVDEKVSQDLAKEIPKIW